MEKAELDINQLRRAYEETPNLHLLAKQFHTSHLRISKLLRDNGVEINNIGKRKDIDSNMLADMRYDYQNLHMTTQEIADKYNIPIKRLRKLFKENDIVISKWNGHVKQEKQIKPRHIKIIEDKPTKNCPYCQWKTYDVFNKSHAYPKHLDLIHNIANLDSINQHIEKYPEDKSYLESKILHLSKIQCKICGKYVSILDDRHLSKHGITKTEYIAKYNPDKLITDSYLTTLQNNMQSMIDNPNWDRFSSTYEKEIQDFLTKNNIQFEAHDRKILGNNKEIDIYIPNKNIAIEFNGCLQHTEWFGKKDRYYHLNKTIGCNNKNIQLIHIFEDEYVYHKNIVYSKLSHLLHINDNLMHIGARKCIVREISQMVASDFLEKNHIQGFVNSTLHIGAFYNDILLGVMSFKKIKNNINVWELTRFATNNNYVCSGLGGKLYSYFIKNYNPEEVKSFADRRWTININNNLYTKLGFKCASFNKPDYHYYYLRDNKPIRFHKFGFRKNTLHRKYNLPLSMTETEMVRELGYDRIWDCGLIKYVWKKDS